MKPGKCTLCIKTKINNLILKTFVYTLPFLKKSDVTGRKSTIFPHALNLILIQLIHMDHLMNFGGKTEFVVIRILTF